jgi:serine acetyltransferase
VTIGEYSIIRAGSVVTNSIPPNKIFAGNPAKQIGTTKTGYTYFYYVGNKSKRKKSLG